jgi:hypothetical protein
VEAAVRASVDARGGGILVTASRSVLYAGEAAGASDLDGYAEAAREAAQALREQIDAALPARA